MELQAVRRYRLSPRNAYSVRHIYYKLFPAFRPVCAVSFCPVASIVLFLVCTKKSWNTKFINYIRNIGAKQRWLTIVYLLPFGVRTGSALSDGLILTCTSLGATNDDCCVNIRILFVTFEYSCFCLFSLLSQTSSSDDLFVWPLLSPFIS